MSRGQDDRVMDGMMDYLKINFQNRRFFTEELAV